MDRGKFKDYLGGWSTCYLIVLSAFYQPERVLEFCDQIQRILVLVKTM